MVLDAILSFATFVEQSRRSGSKKTAERKQLPLWGLLISSSFVLKGSENVHFIQIPYLFDSPPWALVKFLDLESGSLFEVGAY